MLSKFFIYRPIFAGVLAIIVMALGLFAVQLSLWNVPGRVFVGDSLTLKMREMWITPAYVHGAWYRKLNH